MQCQYAQNLFSDYVTGDLDRALAVTLDHHVSDCAACREELAGLRHLWTSLDAMPVVDPPVGLHATLMDRLNAELHPVEIMPTAPRGVVWDLRSLFRPRTLAVAATLLVCLLGGAKLTQNASLGPLSWVHPFSMSRLILQKPHAQWVADTSGTSGSLQIQLIARSTEAGNTGILKATVTLKRHQPGRADMEVHSLPVTLPANTPVTVQIPLPAQPAAQDYSLSVTPGAEMPRPVQLPKP